MTLQNIPIQFVFFSIFLFWFWNPLFAKQIQFALVPDREDIIQYEIELWKSDVLDLEIPFRVLSNPGQINLFIPDGYEYFRIRAVAKRKVRGYWTELYEVNQFGKKKKTKETPMVKIPVKTDVLVPILTKEGNSELFLTTSQIVIVPVSIGKHFKIQYRINSGPWQKSTSPELNFLKDGSYRLEYKVTNELGVSDGMQVWEFKVDSTPPETSINFLHPTFQKNGKSFISNQNPIQIFAIDSGSGINSIRYRMTCNGAQSSDYMVWNETSWKEILSSCQKDLLLEFSAIDRLGNEEIPKKIYIQKSTKGE